MKLKLILIFLLIPLIVGAIENPVTSESFEDLLNSVINFLKSTALAAAPIMFVIAAYYFVTSEGNPEKISTGKRIIFYTFLAIIIILLASELVNVIKGMIK